MLRSRVCSVWSSIRIWSLSENGSVLVGVNNFDVVFVGVQNGTENFGAQYADESLDLVKIDSELVVNNFDVNLGVENGTENFGAQNLRESLDLL